MNNVKETFPWKLTKNVLMQKIDKRQIKQFALVSEIEKSLLARDTGYEYYHISGSRCISFFR